MSDSPTGRRRGDRVLSGEFVADLGALDDEELRSRRSQAQAEEHEVSYVRRLLQGRLDVLRREVEARRTGDTSTATTGKHDDELVAALSRILADAPQDRGQAGARFVGASAPDQAERRRRPEQVADDVRLSDPAALDDAALASAVGRLEAVEADLSATRRRLFEVIDTLGAEVERRVASGAMPADI